MVTLLSQIVPTQPLIVFGSAAALVVIALTAWAIHYK
ncbi:hypothetical protein STSP2_01443 [Anaerohalosphaera lusitana]|uniref:Uncharacterized protein n=1 Tax=Anaerohalosphaera lusitana TaxID=1936003 RepID=A0A1U9NKE1_9BACT|nr:hypothetical protein STSP2_01443 [Anaerohalosphaera lusitana]